MGVVEVDRREPIADEADALERVVGLGDDLPDRRRVVDVDGDDAAERRVEVGEQVERPVDRRDELVAGVGRVEERPDDGGLDAARRGRRRRSGSRGPCRARRDDEQPAVVGDLGLEAPLGLGRASRRRAGRPPGRCRAGGSAAPCRGSARRTRRRPAAPGSGRRRTRRRRASTRRTRTCSTRSGRAAPRRCRRCGPASVRQSEPAWLRREGDELAALRDGDRRQRGRALLAEAVRVEQDACRRPRARRRSTGRPGPGDRCCGAGTSDRRGATERRRAGSPTARSAGLGSRLDPDARRGPSRSARSGRRSRPASRARRCPRAAGTGRRRVVPW